MAWYHIIGIVIGVVYLGYLTLGMLLSRYFEPCQEGWKCYLKHIHCIPALLALEIWDIITDEFVENYHHLA